MFPYWVKKLFPKKSRPAPRSRRPNRVRLGLEALETRDLMSVSAGIFNGQLVVTGDNSGNNITVDHTLTAAQTIVNGQSFFDSQIGNGIVINSGFGNDTVLIRASKLAVTVNGQGGSDIVTIGDGTLARIFGEVHVTNTFAFTDLIVNDANDNTPGSWGLGSTSMSAPGGTVFSWVQGDLRSLTINAGFGGNDIGVGDTPTNGVFKGTTINTGRGSDIVDITGTTGQLFVNGQSGQDTVTIGTHHDFPPGDGTLRNIKGAIHISNTGFFTDLTIDGSLDGTSHGTLTRTSLTGMSAPITWVEGDINFLTVQAGNFGNNTFTVVDSPFNSRFRQTDLHTGFGSSTVFVQGTTGPLVIHGGAHQDSVFIGSGGRLDQIHGSVRYTSDFGSTADITVDDSADPFAHQATLADNHLLRQGTLTHLAQGDITWDARNLRTVTIDGGTAANTFTVLDTTEPGVSTVARTIINTGTGNDIIAVQGTTTPLTINAGDDALTPSNDTIIVGSPDNKLDPIQGAVTVTAQNGIDTLFVNDQGSTTAHTYTQTDTTFGRDGAATVTFLGFLSQNVHLNRGLQTGAAPMLTDLAFTDTIRAGQLATLSGRLVDADPTQVLSLTVDWGDGSTPVQRTPDRAPFHLTHRYEEPGTYTVHLVWSDSLGKSNSRDLTLTVQPARHGEHDGDPESGDHDADVVSRLDALFALLGNGDGRHHD
jgi:hypothetical protein